VNRRTAMRCAIGAIAATVRSVVALAAQAPALESDVPGRFKETFLDMREDLRDATREGKRMMLYFGQDGCPYCRRLVQVNFAQKDIVDRMRRAVYPIAFNLWGDREVTWLDGSVTSEKMLGMKLRVQFTPTLLFLNESGEIVARINGYYPPSRIRAVLEYVARRLESKQSFADFMRTAVAEPTGHNLHPEPFFMPPPLNLQRTAGSKSLAVFFERSDCAACDEMHAAAVHTRRALEPYEVARVDLFGTATLVTPDGQRRLESEWGRDLAISYTPSVLLFDRAGREVLRIEGYVREHHLRNALDYVAHGAYRKQPSFQRYLLERAAELRAKGEIVTIW
jgi:thioredoxin-related protein